MKKRIYSSVVIVLALALLFVLKIYVSNYFFDAFFVALACYGCYEMSKLLSKIGKYNYPIVATAFPVLLYLVNLYGIFRAKATPAVEGVSEAVEGNILWVLYALLISVAVMALVGICIFVVDLFRRKSLINEMGVRKLEGMSYKKFAFKKALNTCIAFVYPAFLFLFFVFMNHLNELPLEKLTTITSDVSLFVLLTAFIIPMMTDTFAMLTGTVVGGKKLCPKISPNKTISGSVGGILWSVLFGACLYLVFGCVESFKPLMEIFPIWAYLLIVMFGSAVAQGGDLVESVIKRRAKVSDSGKFLPGHGGLLDRIDSHIFMAPYVFVAFLMFLI